MNSREGFTGFLFLLCLIFLMLMFLFYICKDFMCCDSEIEESDETDVELDIEFSKQFYNKAGRNIKYETELLSKIIKKEEQ
tara:strand:+ start:408 stop:650 length:243 start_codon:yes stop_codon:yes gene_type:complete